MMAHTARLITLALAVWWVGACASEPTAEAESTSLAVLGDPCGVEAQCVEALLCVDGLCTDRGGLPEPAPEEADVWRYFDVSDDAVDDTFGDGLSDAGDGLSDATEDAEVGPGTDVQDVSMEDLVDSELASEIQQGDTSEDATEDSVSESDVETEKLFILLKDDSIEDGAGDTYFLLNDGEAWVADLSTPLEGQLKFAEVFLADVSAPQSCGRFRFAIWIPDENGFLPDMPTHVETEEHLLPGGEEGQTIPLSLDVYLEPGPFRIGVILDGPCTDDDVSPALMSDDSGVVDASWLWIPLDGTPPWVPASVFGVDGRWGIRAILESEKDFAP
jgi:hypothetical protein